MENQLNFLLVEDDAVDRKAVCRLLDFAGAQKTDTVESLQEAKEKIRSQSYDAVILDLGLPDSQGVDGIIEFQATAPEVPIVVLTGALDEGTALRSMDLGAEDFINKKTVTQDSLMRSLRFAIERHRRKTEIYRDIDSLKLSLHDAVSEAATDPLTGLPNRRALQRYLEQLAASQPRRSVIVGLADLDHFKSINDSHGHHVGDVILREFSSRLQHSLRATDFAARIGGDEFVVVLGGLQRHEAQDLGERLISHVLANPGMVGKKMIPFSATLALAELEPPFLDLEQILIQTHALLARGKVLGRSRVECSWKEEGVEAREAPEVSETPGYKYGVAFQQNRLVQRTRSIQSMMMEGKIGHHVSFGLGASWPMMAPAINRARLSGRLSEMTLGCMKLAQEWRMENAPGGELHLDIEADAIKPWVLSRMNQIFPDGPQRQSCVLFLHSDLPTQPGSASLSELLLLRRAGFQIGIRGIGDGSTILEHLQLLRPDWIRFDPALTINVGQYEKKVQMLKMMMEMLSPLNAHALAEETHRNEDLRQLTELGFVASYG
jgi:diguanylate cyclase (GGDEF)-like protein